MKRTIGRTEKVVAEWRTQPGRALREGQVIRLPASGTFAVVRVGDTSALISPVNEAEAVAAVTRGDPPPVREYDRRTQVSVISEVEFLSLRREKTTTEQGRTER